MNLPFGVCTCEANFKPTCRALFESRFAYRATPSSGAIHIEAQVFSRHRCQFPLSSPAHQFSAAARELKPLPQPRTGNRIAQSGVNTATRHTLPQIEGVHAQCVSTASIGVQTCQMHTPVNVNVNPYSCFLTLVFAHCIRNWPAEARALYPGLPLPLKVQKRCLSVPRLHRVLLALPERCCG